MSRRVVSFHYVLRNPSGQVIDHSQGAEPITYLEGAGHIIDGLEAQLRGFEAGAKATLAVPAAQAYGERNPEMVQTIKRSLVPLPPDVKAGDRFQTGPGRGSPVVVVTDVTDTHVTLDANHPLAGVDLTFDVEVVEARAATEDEIARAERRCGCGGGGCGCEEGSSEKGDCGCDNEGSGEGDCGCEREGRCNCDER